MTARDAVVCLILGFLACVSGQGLTPVQASQRGAGADPGAAMLLLKQHLEAIIELRKVFGFAPTNMCTTHFQSVCGVAGDTPDSQLQLEMATAPDVYNATDPAFTGGLALVGPARDQRPCNAAAAFTVVGAAEAATAQMARVNASSVQLSEQDMGFCSTTPPLACSSSWDLAPALQALATQQPSQAACNPWRGATLRTAPAGVACRWPFQLCERLNPVAGAGRFASSTLRSAFEVQRHIRRYGAAIAKMDLYDDLAAFYTSNPLDTVYTPGPGAKLLTGPGQGHALLLVGYDNTAATPYFVARNSWSPQWGDSGFFRIAVGAAGILSSWNPAYGVTWSPTKPLPFPLAVTPAANSTNCWLYTAAPGDSLARISWLSGVPLQPLLLDNRGIVNTLEARRLPGTTLRLCNIPALLPAGTPRPPRNVMPKPVARVAAALTQAQEATAELTGLLGIKAALDTAGTMLPDWTAANATARCRWRGVWCSPDTGRVAALALAGPGYVGSLPGAAVLAALPGLRTLVVANSSGVAGSLPEDWASLTKLRVLSLTNTSVSGTLPELWGDMVGLRILQLWGNQLTGPLPSTWPTFANTMELLDLSNNRLNGTLPDSWSLLSNLLYLGLQRNQLEGTLPAVWSQMDDLQLMDISNNAGLTGTLPPEWSQLLELRDLRLVNAPSVTGPLPASWGSLPKVERVLIYNTGVDGTLPRAWGSLRTLKALMLANNGLTGTIPEAWSRMASDGALRRVALYGNPGLGGCLPTGWRGVVGGMDGAPFVDTNTALNAAGVC